MSDLSPLNSSPVLKFSPVVDLTDKNAIVCGSTSGIGQATAMVLSSLGAKITLIARNEEKLAATASELNTEAGQKHDYIVADFWQPEQLKTRVDRYLTDRKIIHILVNNTGGPPKGEANTAKAADIQAAFSQHLICNHLLTQAVVSGMKKVAYGRIINITSYEAKEPVPARGISAIMRGAISSWAKTMANELGQYGITVNNILPGVVKTRRLPARIQEEVQKTGQTEKEVMQFLTAPIPVGRFAQPEEIGFAIAFLASPMAGYINGINLPVDGGITRSL
jgi:3-oxoacyl-[acyl-carrier protein] reductase